MDEQRSALSNQTGVTARDNLLEILGIVSIFMLIPLFGCRVLGCITSLEGFLYLGFSITLVWIFIILLRQEHPSDVFTLWYLFFLMTGIGFGIYFYLDISGSVVISSNGINVAESSSGEGRFFERALKWYLETSTNVKDEIILLSIVVSAVIVPQILSFLISGVFGCGRPPILVSSVTKFAVLSLTKFYCVLAALVMSQNLYIIYKYSIPSVWTLATPFVLLMLTFGISTSYYKAKSFLQYVSNRVNQNILKRIRTYMTKFTAPSDDTDMERSRGEAILALAGAVLRQCIYDPAIRDEMCRLISEEIRRQQLK